MPYYFFRLLVSLLAPFVLEGCADPSPDRTILPEDLKLQAGDIVFRQGASFDSQAVLTADRDGCYSHIGIVVDSAGYPMIVHAVPDEYDYPDNTDHIKMDDPETFFLKSRATIGEVMRPINTTAAYKAAKTAYRLYRLNLPFDHDYNDEDSTRMYCTELVLFSFKSAGIHLESLPRQNIHFPFRFQGYFPSAVHASPKLKSVRQF